MYSSRVCGQPNLGHVGWRCPAKLRRDRPNQQANAHPGAAHLGHDRTGGDAIAMIAELRDVQMTTINGNTRDGAPTFQREAKGSFVFLV